ncbi:MAG: MFS transporter [Chloroflexi bacterium]|nr:MFS transporter [Chloroflexota bacterium]
MDSTIAPETRAPDPVSGRAGEYAGQSASLPTPSTPTVAVVESSAPAPIAVPAKRRRGHIPRVRRPVGIHLRVHTLDSLRHRDFLLLWLSTIFLGAGFWVQQLMVGWLAFHMSGSAFVTSMAVSAQNFPYFFAGPLGGVLADRLDKRKMLITLYTVKGLMTAAFGVLVISGTAETWHLFAYALAMGTSWALTDPMRVSIVPTAVPRAMLVNAYALNSLGFNATRFMIPAIAGFMIVWLGPGETSIMGGICLVGAAAGIFMLDTKKGADLTRRPKAKISEAFEFVRNEPIVATILLMGLIPPLLLGPYIHGLMPVYAEVVFEVGAPGQGLMLAAIGIGGLTGGIIVATIGEFRNKTREMVLSLGAAAILMIAFAHTGVFMLALVMLSLMFLAVMTYFTIQPAIIQSLTPDDLRGRVSSLGIMVFGIAPIGGLAAGYLAERFGAPTATTIAGITLIIALTVLTSLNRRLWTGR